ncbi:MAG: hypothetical protein Q8T11_05060 [Elusimicrobiota bacterium]|jgi:hypothetical protein|nr:hypothetical protein [Elusimicrobiota bacterium]
MNAKSMVAKDLMPWLFVARSASWRPFAKVRCEGGKCVWTERPRGRNSKRAQACAA